MIYDFWCFYISNSRTKPAALDFYLVGKMNIMLHLLQSSLVYCSATLLTYLTSNRRRLYCLSFSGFFLQITASIEYLMNQRWLEERTSLIQKTNTTPLLEVRYLIIIYIKHSKYVLQKNCLTAIFFETGATPT